MAKPKLRGKDLVKLGFEEGPAVSLALEVIKRHYKYHSHQEKLDVLAAVADHPENYVEDEHFAKVVGMLIPQKEAVAKRVQLSPKALPYQVYGAANIEKGAQDQMHIAMRLPIAKAGALMPDAHQGYGLPIGGVLATENAIIPYAVGMDIGCRMCLSVYDMPPQKMDKDRSRFKKALENHSRFGQKVFDKPLDDEVLHHPLFKEIQLVKKLKYKAQQQIGTSGSGNHFVEFGQVSISQYDDHLQLPAGEYLALLSHSGSRGLGANIAQHYTEVARSIRKLPKEAKHLAWLDMDSEAGIEYWLAMNLAGDYASACHHHIHKRMGQFLGQEPIKMVENHHNFAWKEKVNGEELIVHRKGATPAGKNVLGIIPGSMTAPAFIVKGKGVEQAIYSAAHGAGRKMSRTKAKHSITHAAWQKHLAEAGVDLIGGALDEAPFAYKDIHEVMYQQQDLVETLGTFQPKVVRMDRSR